MTNERWIAHITDTHIVPKGEHWCGVEATETATRLAQVVADINARVPQVDLVIHTGDIIDYPSVDAYVHTKELLDALKAPYFLACGNHDHLPSLRKVFTEYQAKGTDRFLQYVIDDPMLTVIMMDSRAEAGKSYGALCTQRITWLKDVLANTTKDSMIFIHHYPVDVQDAFSSSLKLLQYQALEEVIAPYPHVKGVYCGHYHFAFATLWAGKLCWISPSTAPAYQLANDRAIGIHLTPPSYSLHHYKDGFVTSRVISVVDTVAKPHVAKAKSMNLT